MPQSLPVEIYEKDEWNGWNSEDRFCEAGISEDSFCEAGWQARPVLIPRVSPCLPHGVV